jgi:phosphatidylserine/phosphatidylglycerophosphate/cardiolipin synthase-like enzyme
MIFKITLLSLSFLLQYAFAQELSTFSATVEIQSEQIIKRSGQLFLGDMTINQDRRLVQGEGKFLPTEIAQAIFQLDLDLLSDRFKAQDLLDSKILFEKQFFQKQNTDLILPYPTLYDWNNLAHPPLHHLSWPLAKINRLTSKTESNINSKEFHQLLNDITQTELTSHNQSELLQNLELQMRKEQMLLKATKYFWGAVFLVRCDRETMPFYQMLLAKQKQGVDVRLMVDAMASMIDQGRCVKKLQKMGLSIFKVKTAVKNLYREILPFGSRKSTAFHPKFWIQDGEAILVDGVNLLNVHVKATDHNQMYKDAGVYVEGPVVQDAVENFLKLWKQYIGKMPLFMHDVYNNTFQKKEKQRQDGLRGGSLLKNELRPHGLCRFTLQDPLQKNFSSSHAIISAIQNANHYLALTPIEYFLDAENKRQSLYTDFVNSLQNQVITKQVALDYLINRYGSWDFFERYNDENWQDHGNSLLSRKINNKYKRWLFDIGLPRVKEFLHQLRVHNPNVRGFAHSSFNHAKVIVVDNSLVGIGSHNMNDRSFLSDFESMLFCHDHRLAKEVNQMHAKDMLNSTGIQ